MKNLTQAKCIEICKLINPNLTWKWNDHFNMDEPPFYAVNGTGSSNELLMVKIYYKNENIVLIDGNSDNMDETIFDYKSNNKILDIIGVDLDVKISNQQVESHNLIFEKYVEKITDKFSTTVEYRMKNSVILNNNEGLPYNHIIDLNLRIFVESNDFLNSKIVLALTFYAPEPGTGTILHESNADIIIDNIDIFKLDNEYSYSGLDYYGAYGSKLEICNKKLAEKSSRIEQIQFYIDLANLIKIVNAKTFEIRFNKKWELGGCLTKSEIRNFVGLYNALFDNDFKKQESLIDSHDEKILDYWKQGKKLEAVVFYKDYSGTDLLIAKKYVENLCELNGLYVRKEKQTEDVKIDIAIPKKEVPKKQENTTSYNPNCFVITATMGNPYHPIVGEFRAYRDAKLMTNNSGRAFISFYYKVAPFIAKFISKSLFLRTLSFRFFVNPIYKLIKNNNLN